MFKKISIFILVLSIFLPVSLLIAQEEKTLVFRDIRVFDGEKVIQSCTVVVKGAEIVSVGQNVSFPENAEIIEGDNLTLLPGLIDSHTHVFNSDALKQALVFGVTTELDMFMSHQIAKSIKETIASGNGNDMADLFTAGTLVTAPKGHGTQFGLNIPTISDPSEASAFVEDRISEGSDYIKIVYDTLYPDNPFPTISKSILIAVIKAAHEKEKLAVVHVSRLPDAIDAIEAGADGLVHLTSDGNSDPEFGKLVSKQGAFVIPTLTVVESLCGIKSGSSLVSDLDLMNYISPDDEKSLKSSFAISDSSQYYSVTESIIQQLKTEGVPILAGSDAPNPGTAHGASMHRELELLVKAGLKPLDALASATSIPADSFKLGKRGRIHPGHDADLLLVAGDPSVDIKVTRKIVKIWKSGVLVDRSGHLELVKKARDQEKAERESHAPVGSESGLVSDFEDGKISAQFGLGWMTSTDSFMGGKSKAAIKLLDSGSNSSKGSLHIAGEINPGAQYPWAGAIYNPGKAMFAPVNLSNRTEISFWLKGEGKPVVLSFFTKKSGYVPVSIIFEASTEWKEYSFQFSRFNGFDSSGLTGVYFGGNPVPGKFEFQIDEIRFK